jgi:hypothetical protein
LTPEIIGLIVRGVKKKKSLGGENKMRIVNRKEFLALPSGTIFLKYAPINFGELCIKGGTTTSDDFFYVPIPSADCFDTAEFCELFGNAQKDNLFSIPLDFETESRDGLWDQDQLFAVFEKKDIKQFIKVLKMALTV